MLKSKNKALLYPNITINTKTALLAVLSMLVLLVFLNAQTSLVLGPFIALIMCYLFFSEYSEYVIAMIVVANDALGTIFLGSVSFPYLLLILVAFKLAINKRIFKHSLLFLLFSFVLLVQLFSVDFIPFKSLVYSVAFVLSLFSIEKDHKKLNNLFRGIALTVFLISLHACITGGVEFYEFDPYSKEYFRKGILGTGIGDPNYSCFLLNIGLICLWCDEKLALWKKSIITLPFLYAFMITLSTSGLLSLLILIVMGIILGKNKPKALIILLVVCLILISAFQIYLNLPADFRNPTLDAYIARIADKLYALDEGDMTSVTTNRSDLATEYWEYIINQPTNRLLFGGNTLIINAGLVPHNTYLGVILQIGLFGAAILSFCVLKKIITAYSNMIKRDLWFKRIVLLKILCLFVATNLSLYQGNLWALWMSFLFLV